MSRHTVATIAAAMLFVVGLAGNTAFAQGTKYTTPTVVGTAGATSVTITWSNAHSAFSQGGSPGAVVRCTTSTGPTNCGMPVTLTGEVADTAPHTITGLMPATTYYFRIEPTEGLRDLGLTDSSISGVLTVMTANVPPTVSVATPTLTAAPGDTVTLTGSGTGNPAPTFAWTCPTVALTPTDATLDTPTITPTPANAATATFTAPALTDPTDATKTADTFTVTCTLTATSGGDMVTAQTVVTIRAAAGGGGAAADEAVLPNVLRNITNGINSGIFNRIQQRQTQDGKWK